MLKQFYFLSPVEVVKVTGSNLQEVAEWCGGRVASTESRRIPGRMDSYVWVPTPKGTAISWAFPGMFITKRLVRTVKDEIKITFAVFRKDYFDKNYFESPGDAVAATWERAEKDAKKHAKAAPKPTAPKKKGEIAMDVLMGEKPVMPAPVSEPVDVKMGEHPIVLRRDPEAEPADVSLPDEPEENEAERLVKVFEDPKTGDTPVGSDEPANEELVKPPVAPPVYLSKPCVCGKQKQSNSSQEIADNLLADHQKNCEEFQAQEATPNAAGE